jgi:hypothetical protein
MTAAAKILDKSGNPIEVSLDETIYRKANAANQSVPQYLNNQYPEADASHGTVFEQLCESTGLILRNNSAYGVRAPSVKAVLEGTAQIDAAAITRDASPASRVLFPAVILEAIENQLMTERVSQPDMFEKMVAISDTVAGARVEQPVINFANADSARSQPIAQLSTPPAMVRITTSDVTRKIPTFSLGMEMSKEAAATVTLDLTTLTLARQVAVERDLRVQEYINAFLTGDADNGQAALASVASNTLDAASTGGTLTHRAWIRFLARNRRKRKITHVVCDLDTALKIEARTGRPTVFSADNPNANFNSVAYPINFGVDNGLSIFIVDDGVIPAGTILALDARYAVRRIRNSEAEYQAAEEFVLKKSLAMRFDFGEIAYRLFDDAWDVLTITP